MRRRALFRLPWSALAALVMVAPAAGQVGVSRYTLDVSSRVSARVPHPMFFGRDRSISGTIPLTRDETAVHSQALAIVPATRSVTVTLFGGPTFLTVEQGLVTDVRFTHAYPYDGAEFSDAMTPRP